MTYLKIRKLYIGLFREIDSCFLAETLRTFVHEKVSNYSHKVQKQHNFQRNLSLRKFIDQTKKWTQKLLKKETNSESI